MRKRPFSSSSETQSEATSVSRPGQGTRAETFRPLIRPILVALRLCGVAGGRPLTRVPSMSSAAFAQRRIRTGRGHPSGSFGMIFGILPGFAEMRDRW